MPYINLKTTVSVDSDKGKALKAKFGKAIENFPGKSEKWLVVGVEDNARLWFAGSDEGCAYTEVALLGTASDAAYESMTAALTDIISSELAISPDKIYIKYEECTHWGWNGGNF
ncbi:MAG: hypothetical protein GX051_04595 [Clostridiales bacterium]|nr:hypothetical protein [Clostridiales bacterium]